MAEVKWKLFFCVWGNYLAHMIPLHMIFLSSQDNFTNDLIYTQLIFYLILLKIMSLFSICLVSKFSYLYVWLALALVMFAAQPCLHSFLLTNEMNESQHVSFLCLQVKEHYLLLHLSRLSLVWYRGWVKSSHGSASVSRCDILRLTATCLPLNPADIYQRKEKKRGGMSALTCLL